MVTPEVIARAAGISAIVLDVDGVLTDGRIIYDEFGDELKCFDVRDGAAMVMWKRAGLRSGIITGRKSRLVKRRAKEMLVDYLVQGAVMTKLAAYEKFLKRFKLSHEQVCAVGDDLMDLPILRRAGLAVTVPGAPEEIQHVARYVTQQRAGRGAVRETIEIILKAKGLWGSILERYSI